MFHGSAQTRPFSVAASTAAGKCGVELTRAERRRQVEQPARPRELRHPDHVHHHDVDPGVAALEVHDVELVLLV